MSTQIGLLLLILAASLVFFILEWVSADVVALGTVLALVLTGLSSPSPCRTLRRRY